MHCINNNKNLIKEFCQFHKFSIKRTKVQINVLQNYLNKYMYCTIIMIHNQQKLYESLNSQRYQKNYPNTTQFTNSLIVKYIKEIMQQENFILI